MRFPDSHVDRIRDRGGSNAGVTIYHAAAVRDALGVSLRPGSVATACGRVAGVGGGAELRARFKGAVEVELGGKLLLPAMVNAHAHLDLTAIGPVEYGGDFVGWLRGIVAKRPRGGKEISDSVRKGLEMSRAGGVGWIGDVAGSAEAAISRVGAGKDLAIPGVSYVECLGIGRGQVDGFIELRKKLKAVEGAFGERESKGGVEKARLGMEPHSPYSVGSALYSAVGRLAEERGFALCTHLAESREEVEFVRDGKGPLADLLRSMGKWDDTLAPGGMHPVDWLEQELRRGGWLIAHCNFIDDEQIGVLASGGVSVAYCPVASEYFRLPGDGRGHRYREMIGAGVNVCLGTDSIVCQPAGEAQPMGILPQMRRLYRRDGFSPEVLLRMATVNGLRAMGMKENLASFGVGAVADFIAIEIREDDPTEALLQAMESDERATFASGRQA